MTNVLPAPADLTVTAGDGHADLAWLPVEGAAKYHVYADGLDPEETSKPHHKLTGLQNGRRYTFMVAAVAEDETEGRGSRDVTATPMPREHARQPTPVVETADESE